MEVGSAVIGLLVASAGSAVPDDGGLLGAVISLGNLAKQRGTHFPVTTLAEIANRVDRASSVDLVLVLGIFTGVRKHVLRHAEAHVHLRVGALRAAPDFLKRRLVNLLHHAWGNRWLLA